MSNKWNRIVRPATPQERERHAEIREKVMQEFPPLAPPQLQPAAGGIGAQIRAARKAQGLTRFALARQAGMPASSTIRDIEYDGDVKLSDVRAVARTLGLEITLIPTTTS